MNNDETFPPLVMDGTIDKDVDLEIMIDHENNVYIKFTGFEDEFEATNYAAHLEEIIPLLFFESPTKH